MLVEIRSDKFRVGSIPFHPGLNVVLGDDNATNSIGKSTLLMVVDFALGGSSLLEHNTDLVAELGHHDYFFKFQFAGNDYVFRRGTIEPGYVYRCNDKFEPEETLDLAEYTAFLKTAYGIHLDLSFRTLVGLYTRVWGKENLNVKRPLHIVSNAAARECVVNLLKTYGRYREVEVLAREVAELETKQKVIRAASRNEVIPKIGKRDYSANTVRIAELERDLENIKSELAKYATNIGDLVNKEMLDLKIDRDALAAARLKALARLRRTERNLSENRHIQAQHFHGLLEYFPELNSDRLAEVEEFHNDLARILRQEIRQSERDLKEQIRRLDSEIASIDARMAETLKSVEEPGQLVDRVYQMATSLEKARLENEQFEGEADLKQKLTEGRRAQAAAMETVLAQVQEQVNRGMREIVDAVFGPDRKSPRLTLREHSYEFEVFEDTGTGTAYAGMIVLDLTVFRQTRLPLVAHDTVLFKNIENDSVARLVGFYQRIERQSFVALDEIRRYGKDTAALLRRNAVIELSDSAVLYVRDWRSDKAAP